MPSSEPLHTRDASQRSSAKRDRAQYRPTADQKELLVLAAAMAGQTLSDFIRTAVDERAKRVIADQERIVLSGQARERFFAALENPPKPNDHFVSLTDPSSSLRGCPSGASASRPYFFGSFNRSRASVGVSSGSCVKP
jgi:uncharacterized protein (DUF1778 family)